jgi:hypothetical protein
MVLSLDCQWIRACGGTLPCSNNSEKDSSEIRKNKSENGKLYESGKNVHKKITAPTLVLINRFLYCSLQFFVALGKGNVQQLFLEFFSYI